MVAGSSDEPKSSAGDADRSQSAFCLHIALDSLMAASDRLDPTSVQFRQTVALMRSVAQAIDDVADVSATSRRGLTLSGRA